MRQWMVNPNLMCRKHLLGEHVEMHMFVGTIKAGKKLDGYFRDGLLNSAEIKSRHDELVAEMERRGMNHTSALEENPTPIGGHRQTVDSDAARVELVRRCVDCAELHRADYPDLVALVHNGGDRLVKMGDGKYRAVYDGEVQEGVFANRDAADRGMEKIRRLAREKSRER